MDGVCHSVRVDTVVVGGLWRVWVLEPQRDMCGLNVVEGLGDLTRYKPLWPSGKASHS